MIAGDSLITTAPSGGRGAMLRAYDKATGNEVGAPGADHLIPIGGEDPAGKNAAGPGQKYP